MPHLPLCLTKEEFIDGIRFLLNSTYTYIQFIKKFYKQIAGAPMGFCTSPWFADITMEALEINTLNKLKSSSVLKDKSYFSEPHTQARDNVLFI